LGAGIKLRNRRSIRLTEYDYSQAGSYFVTICVSHREHKLGQITSGHVYLSKAGEIVDKRIQEIDNVGMAVVMPNHVHMLLNINRRGGVTPPLHQALGQVVAKFKYSTTKTVNELQGTPGVRFWQRNYYERVVRNDREYEAIYQYILSRIPQIGIRTNIASQVRGPAPFVSLR
jgi:REP element-mobilizing transposase RayT